MVRPISYEFDQAIADEVCEATEATPLGLRAICKANKHFPPARIIRAWRDRHPLFNDQYTRAKAAQMENMADEIIEISDDSTRDVIEGNDGLIINSAAINRDRLRIDSRKWLAGKLAPKIYGDRKDSDDKDGTDFISKNRDKISNR